MACDGPLPAPVWAVTISGMDASVVLQVELDGRVWWNSTCIERAKALAAPYLQHGRRVVIRSHDSNRDRIAIYYDAACRKWIDLPLRHDLADRPL